MFTTFALTARAMAIDHPGDERHRDTRSREGDDREGCQLAVRRDVHRLELEPAAPRTGVSAVEEPAPQEVHSLAIRCGSSPKTR